MLADTGWLRSIEGLEPYESDNVPALGLGHLDVWHILMSLHCAWNAAQAPLQCCAGMSWGNGFTINQTLIQQYNLSDPSGFFEDITNVTALTSHTILSVHVYGPNITVRRHLLHFKADHVLPA